MASRGSHTGAERIESLGLKSSVDSFGVPACWRRAGFPCGSRALRTGTRNCPDGLSIEPRVGGLPSTIVVEAMRDHPYARWTAIEARVSLRTRDPAAQGRGARSGLCRSLDERSLAGAASVRGASKVKDARQGHRERGIMAVSIAGWNRDSNGPAPKSRGRRFDGAKAGRRRSEFDLAPSARLGPREALIKRHSASAGGGPSGWTTGLEGIRRLQAPTTEPGAARAASLQPKAMPGGGVVWALAEAMTWRPPSVNSPRRRQGRGELDPRTVGPEQSRVTRKSFPDPISWVPGVSPARTWGRKPKGWPGTGRDARATALPGMRHATARAVPRDAAGDGAVYAGAQEHLKELSACVSLYRASATWGRMLHSCWPRKGARSSRWATSSGGSSAAMVGGCAFRTFRSTSRRRDRSPASRAPSP